MTDTNSNYTHSITASLNDIDEDLNNHIHNTYYWAALHTPSINLGSTMGASPSGYDDKYLNYRYRCYSTESYPYAGWTPDQRMNVQITPSIEGEIPFYDIYSETLSYRGKYYQPQQRYTMYYPPYAVLKLPRPASYQGSPTAYDWQYLLDRAQCALGIRNYLKPSETTIKNIFERLLTKVEEHNIYKNHKVPGNKEGKTKIKNRGSVLKNLARDDDDLVEDDLSYEGSGAQASPDGTAARREKLYELSKKYKKDVIYNNKMDYLPLELYNMKLQLQDQSKTYLLNLLLKCAQLLPNPELVASPAEIPLLLKQMIKNSPQLINLQNLILFSHEKLSNVYNSIPEAPELECYTVFCQKLLQNYIFITERQISFIQNLVADYRELVRFRARVADFVGHQLQLANKNGQISIYDSMKQNGAICEKLQLSLNQHGSRGGSSDLYLAAEELLLKATQCGIGVNPTGNSGLGQVGDTVLYSQGQSRDSYLRQCVNQATAEAPRLLIRLTDEEAYQAFNVIIFVVNYFSRLFNTPSIQNMVAKLAELHMYVSTSKTLIANIRKNLGLQSNASANKIIEAVQVLSTKALEDAGFGDVLNYVKIMLKVNDEEEIVDKLAVLIRNNKESEPPEEGEEADEDD